MITWEELLREDPPVAEASGRTRWQCGDCGRFVKSATVTQDGGGPPDWEPYASGDCSKCGRGVDVYGVG